LNQRKQKIKKQKKSTLQVPGVKRQEKNPNVLFLAKIFDSLFSFGSKKLWKSKDKFQKKHWSKNDTKPPLFLNISSIGIPTASK